MFLNCYWVLNLDVCVKKIKECVKGIVHFFTFNRREFYFVTQKVEELGGILFPPPKNGTQNSINISSSPLSSPPKP